MTKDRNVNLNDLLARIRDVPIDTVRRVLGSIVMLETETQTKQGYVLTLQYSVWTMSEKDGVIVVSSEDLCSDNEEKLSRLVGEKIQKIVWGIDGSSLAIDFTNYVIFLSADLVAYDSDDDLMTIREHRDEEILCFYPRHIMKYEK